MRIDIVSGQPGADIDSVVEEMKQLVRRSQMTLKEKCVIQLYWEEYALTIVNDALGT